jgi:hypothetical protein
MIVTVTRKTRATRPTKPKHAPVPEPNLKDAVDDLRQLAKAGALALAGENSLRLAPGLSTWRTGA